MSDWFCTASGRQFFPLKPRAEDILLADIVHALPFLNRFNGHTRFEYSVGQHTVHMVQVAGADVRLAQYCFLHDASEAYLGDVVRPLKHTPEMLAYRNAEQVLQAMIYRKFGLPEEEPPALKVLDRRMLRTEQAALMPAVSFDRRDDVPVFENVTIRPMFSVMVRNMLLQLACKFGWT